MQDSGNEVPPQADAGKGGKGGKGSGKGGKGGGKGSKGSKGGKGQQKKKQAAAANPRANMPRKAKNSMGA